jgi:hypothetical protein
MKNNKLVGELGRDAHGFNSQIFAFPALTRKGTFFLFLFFGDVI